MDPKGMLGAVAGTLAGYQARMRLVKQLRTKDLPVALAEDVVAVVAVVAALLLASRVHA